MVTRIKSNKGKVILKERVFNLDKDEGKTSLEVRQMCQHLEKVRERTLIFI
jgi:hypothetical protein